MSQEAAAAEAAAAAAAAAVIPRDESLEEADSTGEESRKRGLESAEEAPAAKAQAGGVEAPRRAVVPVQEAPSLDWLHDG